MDKFSPLPPRERLLEALSYDPERGILTWKERPEAHFISPARRRNWNSRYVGKPAFSTLLGNRFRGRIDYCEYLAHRIIWKMVHGEEPEEIDHINGDPSDNRLSNLRAVTGHENSLNLSRRIDNTSGVTGVTYDKRRRKWLAQICLDGKGFALGRYRNIEDAINARKAAEARMGFHANHGREKVGEGRR